MTDVVAQPQAVREAGSRTRQSGVPPGSDAVGLYESAGPNLSFVRQRVKKDAGRVTPSEILLLQRTIGNRAVNRLPAVAGPQYGGGTMPGQSRLADEQQALDTNHEVTLNVDSGIELKRDAGQPYYESLRTRRKIGEQGRLLQRAAAWPLQRQDSGEPPTNAQTGQQPADNQQPSSAKLAIPLKQKVVEGSYPVPLKYAEVEFKISVEVAGQIEVGAKNEDESGPSQETAVAPLGFDSGALALSIAHSWVNKDGINILGWDSAFTEVKLEGAMKVDKGLKVNLAGSGKLACGVELALELTLIKISEDWSVKGPGATVKAEIPWFPFDVPISSGLKISNVQVHPIVEIEIKPNYKQILGEVAKDVGEDVAGEQAAEKAGELGAALLGADAAIIGGFLLAGAGAIGGTILAYKDADDIAATHGQCTALAGRLTEGFRIGIVGGAAPSEKEMIQGYTQGIQNFNAARSALKQKNPDADDATLKTAIAAQSDAAVAQAGPQILSIAQDTVWNKYASSHQDTWYHSYDFDRWAAWSNIYGNDPLGDPRYTRYCPKNVCEHGMR